VKHALLRSFRWLITTIVVVFAIVELANMVIPGVRMSLLAVLAAVGAATLGMVSYELGKAGLRRLRSRRLSP
jgi:hypothetical protein